MQHNEQKIAWVLLIAVLLLFTFSCSKKGPSEAIRKFIDEGSELAEQHKIRDLMKLTTENFTAQSGQHDKNSVRKVLFAAFKH